MVEAAKAAPRLGVIGLGAMGGPMARNLAKAGYEVCGFDLDATRVQACVAAGVSAAEDVGQVVAGSDVVLTSLPSSEAFVQLAETHLLPLARAGQIFIDLGTVTPPETRRLAAALAQKGASLIDAPVSGGPSGAESGTLRMFIGGDPVVAERCRPIFEVLGDPQHTAYCGPAGNGQIVKGVNQLAMGLGAAAYLEAVAFGIRAGVDPQAIRTAVGGSGGPGDWRAYVDLIARRAAEGEAEEVGVKFRELPYFLREAESHGLALPLTRALYDFCDAGERVVVDDNRPAPSFWHELLKGAPSPLQGEGAGG